jgi:uncharacterized membrane protein YozB (DUF420 family)
VARAKCARQGKIDLGHLACHTRRPGGDDPLRMPRSLGRYDPPFDAKPDARRGITRESARRPKLLFGACVEASMRRRFSASLRPFFLFVMLLGSALITLASVAYFDLDTLPPFVIEKLPVRFESLWLASLRAHVASASLSFPLCLLLMTRWLQRRATWHRRLGRVAGVLVLFGLVPSGIILSFDAKGGAAVTAGFLLSAVIVAWAMVRGVLAARRRQFAVHSRAMRHAVAQMSVAVSSRALILGLNALGVDPDVTYVAALWGPVLISAAVAELISLPKLTSTSKAAHLVERIVREVSPIAVLLRVRAVLRPVARFGR